jgi:hypothetical protein
MPTSLGRFGKGMSTEFNGLLHRLSILPLAMLAIVLILATVAVCEMHDARRASDVVILTNGDRVSGELTRVDNVTVEIRSASLGVLKIPWDAVRKVTASGGRWARETDGGISEAALRYANFNLAEFRLIAGNVEARIDSSEIQVTAGSVVVLDKDNAKQEIRPDHTAGPPVAPPVKKPAAVPAALQFGVDAPQTVVDGTTSQETFGGNVRLLYRAVPLCGAASWSTATYLSASHNRNWKVKSPANVTDTYDGIVTLTNQLFKGSKTSFFAMGDLFGNSSLGIGLQQSYGGGLSRVLYASVCAGKPHNYILSVAGRSSLRYIHQRLYSPGKNLELAGLNFQGSVSYTPLFKDSKGAAVERFSSDLTLWAMPTVNEIRAIQAGGSLSISAPLTDRLSIAINEEDDFINNAPKAKRKNYLKSGLTLSYTFPAAPH